MNEVSNACVCVCLSHSENKIIKSYLPEYLKIVNGSGLVH